MSVLLVAAAVLGYFATGLLVMLSANWIAEDTLDRDMFWQGVGGWPIVLFIAAVGCFAVRSAQAELDKL